MTSEDMRTLVEQLRFAAQTANHDAEAIRALVERYSAATAQANDRLRQCRRLLERGLRTEALQISESEPKLLEIVQELDFPEREEWSKTVRRLGLTPPPALLSDVVLDLNDAYRAQAPLAHLLRSHRLLALFHAPLTLRINVLRKIAAIDIGTPFWEEDLKAFEKVRLQQLQQELATADRQGDGAALARVIEELERTPWREGAPPRLMEAARRSGAAQRTISARQTIKELQEQLRDAFACRDVSRGRETRDRWQRIVGAAGLLSNDPALQGVETELAWLDDMDRREEVDAHFASLVAAFEAALDLGAPAVELERLYDALQATSRPLPDVLTVRFQRRMQSLQASESRRTLRLVIVCVSLVIIVALLVAVVLWSSREGIRKDSPGTPSNLRSRSVSPDLGRVFDGDPVEASDATSRLNGMMREAKGGGEQ